MAIVGIVGFGSGSVWQAKRIKEVKRELINIHQRCYEKCHPQRIEMEHRLELSVAELTASIKFTLDTIQKRQTKVFEILDNLSANVQRLTGWLERNGNLPKDLSGD